MNTTKPIYETGATSHAVNDLILFTDNTSQLADLRDNIYTDWANVGNFGTGKTSDKFIVLFEAARRHYVNDCQSAGHILRMGKDEIYEYCHLYAQDFPNWKKENGYS
jgi:hypothetical protein